MLLKEVNYLNNKYWFLKFEILEDNKLFYIVRVCNENFDIEDELKLTKEEFNIFEKIMENNKDALLYKNHPIFEKVSKIKIIYKEKIIKK